jgi:hypothetical protein
LARCRRVAVGLREHGYEQLERLDPDAGAGVDRAEFGGH